MSSTATTLRHRAEGLAAGLPPLLVEARQVAFSVAQGVHGRRRVGQGESFWQFRRYQPGDSPQQIDWRQSAKSDHVFVRELEWEAAQSVWIWRDASPSMAWSSDQKWPEKRARAELLTLALAVLLVRGGEHVALLGAGQRPSSSQATLGRMTALLSAGLGEGEHLPLPVPLPRHGQLVLIGDFLGDFERTAKRLRGFAERGLHGHILQVLDPAEELLPYDGRVRFVGLEGEEPWLLPRVETVRESYERRINALKASLRSLAQSLNWGYSLHRTDRPPQTALMALYQALASC